MSGTLTAVTADNEAPSYAVTEQPLHGTVAVDGDVLTYTPAAGFVGSDPHLHGDRGRRRDLPRPPSSTSGSGRRPPFP